MSRGLVAALLFAILVAATVAALLVVDDQRARPPEIEPKNVLSLRAATVPVP